MSANQGRDESPALGWRGRLAEPLAPERARQIRRHLILIPVYVWIVFALRSYAIDISAPGNLDRSGHMKGHDFAHFYVQGQIARDHAVNELYSFDAHSARADALFPEYQARFLPVHPPQVAVFFAPLAAMPYSVALFVWIGTSIVVYAVCCRALWSSLLPLRRFGGTSLLLAAGFPAFYSLIAFGQTAAFALAWVTAGYFAFKHERPWAAGFALGALAYKPSLLLVMPIAWLFAWEWKTLAAAVISAGAQFMIAWGYLGSAAISGFIENLRTVARFESLLESRPQLMHSLKSFFSLLMPWSSIAWMAYVIAGAVVVIVAVRVWRSGAPIELRYSVLLLATVLVDPHVYSSQARRAGTGTGVAGRVGAREQTSQHVVLVIDVRVLLRACAGGIYVRHASSVVRARACCTVVCCCQVCMASHQRRSRRIGSTGSRMSTRPHFLELLLKKTPPPVVLRNERTGEVIASRVEGAFDSVSRRRGLLGRTGMGDDEVLVIAPCNAIHTFFMKFAIDVIFARRDGEVVKVCPNVVPGRIALAPTSFATLEFASGTAERAGVIRGDRLVLGLNSTDVSRHSVNP